MPIPLQPDLKERAEKLCERDYPYLKVHDPGSVLAVDGRTLVFVRDQEERGLWLELPSVV
jgi:hypothetical protein